MSDSDDFEAFSCSVEIDTTVATTSGEAIEDGGSRVSMVFRSADGEQTRTINMSREVFNAFLIEHVHLADAPDPDDAPPIVVGRSGGTSG